MSVHPRVTAVPRKRPRSFCQKCRWQVTPKLAYTFDPVKSEWADYATVHWDLSGNELTRNSSGNTQSQSFQLGEPLWTDPGLKSGTSVRELISTLKKKKSAQAGNELSNILPKSSQARKKSPSPVGDKSCQRVYFVFINDTIRDPEMSSMLSLLMTVTADDLSVGGGGRRVKL